MEGARRVPSSRTDSSPTQTDSPSKASQVLAKHEDEFFDVVVAKHNLLRLSRKKVITDELITKIENSDNETAQEVLFDHLKRNADVATLREYCKMAIASDAFPKMQKLGKKMLCDLPPEAGQASGQTGSQTGAQAKGSKIPVSSKGTHRAKKLKTEVLKAQCGECRPLTSPVSPEYDVEDVRRYVKRALRQAQYQELKHSKVIKDLYHNTYMRIFDILERNRLHQERMVRAAQVAIQLELGEDEENIIPDGLTVKELLDKLCISKMWDNTDLLCKIVNFLPEDEKSLALVLLERYEMYLLFYNIAVKLKHSPIEVAAASEVTDAQAQLEVTVAKDLDEISRMDCEEMVLLLFSKACKIPPYKIKARAFWPGNSATIAFVINKSFMQNILKYLFEGNSMWAFKELGVIRVRIPSLFEVDVSELLTRHFKEALRSGLTGDMDFVAATKALPYQVYAFLDPDRAEQLQAQTIRHEIVRLWPEQDESVSGTAVDEGVEPTPEIFERRFPLKVEEEEKNENEGKELLPRVQRLEDELRGSKQNMIELIHGNRALQNELKAIQEEEGHIRQELASLRETLPPVLWSQVGEDKPAHLTTLYSPTAYHRPQQLHPIPLVPASSSSPLKTAPAHDGDNLELYVKHSCPNRELTGLMEIVESAAASSDATIRMVEFSEGEQPATSYRRYEVPLKPGTDTKQLVKELCKNEAVQQVAIVRPRGGNEEGVYGPICTLL